MRTSLGTLFSLALFCLSLLPGCRSHSGTGGGIEVGNGMQNAYYSQRYGFTLHYSSELQLTETSPELVRIDNSPVVAKMSTKAETSSLEFRGAPAETAHIKDLAGLQDFVQQKFAALGFAIKPADPAQGAGVSAEKEEAGKRSGFYYFFSPSGKVLQFVMEAFSAGEGFNLVAPVIKTFGYDGTPPTIRRVKIAEYEVRAGDRLTLEIEAEDSGSGLVGGKLSILLVNTAFWKGSGVIEYSTPISEKDRVVDNRWVFSLPTGPYRPEGYYVGISVSLSDRAGNRMERVTAVESKGKWKPLTAWTAQPIKAVERSLVFERDAFGNLGTEVVDKPMVVHLKANRPDTTPPEYLDLKFDPVVEMAKAPTPTKFVGTLRVKDDVSGIIGGRVSIKMCTDPEGADFRYVPGLNLDQPILAGHKVGPDTYQLAFYPKPYIPSHTYFPCFFSLFDAAGNEVTPLDVKASVKIKNPNPPDELDPVILGAAVSPSKVKIGSTASFRVRVFDNNSLVGGKVEAVLIPVEPTPSSSEITLSASITEENLFSKVEVRIDFKTSPFIRPGKYMLSELTVTDASANARIKIFTSYKHPPEPPKGGIPAPAAAPIPLPEFEVVP